MTYGYSIEPTKADPLVDLVDRMVANLSLASTPLSWAVDIIPALKYLPDGFPGTAFKETARRWKKHNQAVAEIPYSFVLRQMATRSYRPSYVSNMVQQCSNGNTEALKLSYDDEHAIKWTAAVMYAAGSDTTVATLKAFFLAMTMFPEVQRKAQEEIDGVTGADRLPCFEDRNRLPYIEGVVKEAFRWSPVAPMGFPHVVSENTIYNGYLIPKGATLLPAVWWFLHDPEVYIDPSSFNPQRYLEPRNEPDPKTVAFGYGRRICPGRYFADSGVFISIVQILASFNITKMVDEHGKEIEVTLGAIPGQMNFPEDFPYKIMPRSAKQAELLTSIEIDQY
jgi:cytochrome P450